ncbi:MAG TPA: serine hydrolase [Phenylobacterium sp.]
MPDRIAGGPWSRLAAAAFGAALALATPAAAQTSPTFPDAPNAQYVKTWLAAVGQGDVSAMKALDPQAVGVWRQSGGYDLLAVEGVTATQVTALVRARLTGNYLRLTWVFDASTPPKLVGLRGQPAAPPPGLPPVQRLDDAALGDFLRSFMDRSDFSGAVLVARRGKPIFTAVRGLADRERQVPITLESRFRVGSMDKMFTAVAILQLAQAGKLRLDAPIGTYLKDYPNADFARTVTVHQLLTHTGGAGDIFTPAYLAKRLQVKSLQDYVGLFGARAPEFTPGTRWSYANYGFILLGRIVEEVSGRPYYDYVADHIFKPAGMTRSGFEPEDVAVEGRVAPYTSELEGYQSATDTLPYRGTSAGGGYATVGDFLAFADALAHRKLLDEAHYRLLTTRKANGSYAYGLEDGSRDGVRVFGHSGGAPGQNGDFRVIGDGELVVIALSNVTPPARASQLADLVLNKAIVRKRDGSVAAIAAGPPPPPTLAEREALFRANDRNGDGRLDRNEFRAVVAALAYPELQESLFAQRDTDKDGFISLAEVRAELPR